MLAKSYRGKLLRLFENTGATFTLCTEQKGPVLAGFFPSNINDMDTHLPPKKGGGRARGAPHPSPPFVWEAGSAAPWPFKLESEKN